MESRVLQSSATILLLAAVLVQMSVAVQIPPPLTIRPTIEHDVDMAEWHDVIYDGEVPQRHLLAVDQSRLIGDSNWRVIIKDTLNDWRRTVSASNMHYTVIN